MTSIYIEKLMTKYVNSFEEIGERKGGWGIIFYIWHEN
jgi:hypothetical protein